MNILIGDYVYHKVHETVYQVNDIYTLKDGTTVYRLGNKVCFINPNHKQFTRDCVQISKEIAELYLMGDKPVSNLSSR